MSDGSSWNDRFVNSAAGCNTWLPTLHGTGFLVGMVERTSGCSRTAATTSIDTAIAIAAPTCSGSSIPLPRSWNCTGVTCTITRPRLQSRSILVTRCTGWAPWTTVPIPRFNRYRIVYSYRGNRRAVNRVCEFRVNMIERAVDRITKIARFDQVRSGPIGRPSIRPSSSAKHVSSTILTRFHTVLSIG